MPEERFIDYPKLNELIKLKDELIEKRKTVINSLNLHNFQEFLIYLDARKKFKFFFRIFLLIIFSQQCV